MQFILLFIPCLKNTANQRPGKPLHILRYPAGSISSRFPLITCERYQNGAKKYMRALKNGAKVFGQRRKFLVQVMAAEEENEVLTKIFPAI